LLISFSNADAKAKKQKKPMNLLFPSGTFAPTGKILTQHA